MRLRGPAKSGEQAAARQHESLLERHAHDAAEPVLLTTYETAEYLRLTRSCLAKWRCAGGGRGPDFILAGRKVLYAKATLDGWLETRRRSSTSNQTREAGM